MGKKGNKNIDRMKELIKEMNESKRGYDTTGYSSLSDREYDRMEEELEELERKEGVVLSSSPTKKVGFVTLDKFSKVEHEYRMLSLDKTKEVGKLEKFLGEMEGLLSYKIDGLTVILVYEGGELVNGSTRGTGKIGEDITDNVRQFSNIPLRLGCKERITIRGEAVITFKNFEEINRVLIEEERYKNPRNLCSGTVRNLDSQVVKRRKVEFNAFELVNQGEMGYVRKEDSLEFLRGVGFSVVEYVKVGKGNVREEVERLVDRKDELEYLIDGLVLCFNDVEYSKSLGEKEKSYKDAMAYKLKDETVRTVVKGVEFSLSRTGLLNPVAILEPVKLLGTTVSRASLHNISLVERLEIGVGDEVEVCKANMIIPQILENYTRSSKIEIPKKCPECGEGLEIVQENEGKFLVCLNPFCKAQLVGRLVHFVSRDALNIEGVSESTVEKLVDNGLLENYSSFYELKNKKEEFENIYGLSGKTFNQLVLNVESSREVSIERYIYGLGIKHIGISNARLLCSEYRTVDEIKGARAEDMLKIRGMGEVIANSVERYFKDDRNIKNLEVEKYLNIRSLDVGEGAQGEGFVITGKLGKFSSRKELEKDIEVKGHRVLKSVTKSATYLINNDKKSESAKNKKALSMGVEIITEEEYLSKF